MNLYRLDYLAPDGSTDACTDWRGDYLSRQYAQARTDAKKIGDATGAVIQITRISGAGSMKVVARYSGETHRFHRA